MYYMKKNDEKKLIYYCKHCNYEDAKLIETKNMKVFEFSKEDSGKNAIINEYTRHDPTLPHVKTIKCPNFECESNKNENIEHDVIYIRVDDSKMKYMYLCYHCNSSWKP
jgi:DNA-directed RNA polymerase subunit M/transcription elongation factor TFIIS